MPAARRIAARFTLAHAGAVRAAFLLPMTEPPKLCRIEWLDINTHTGPWVDLPDSTRPSECFSVGWLIYEDEDYVTISATYSDGDDNRQALVITAIPRGCIKRLEYLDLGKLLVQPA